MIYKEALLYIHSRKRLPSQDSLARIEILLDRIGHPERELQFVHITGTNGKGSVSTMLSSIAREGGKKTGLFTSPYVLDFRERFQVNGVMITEQDFVRLVEKVQPVADQMEREHFLLSEFELDTALAFLYFKEQKCEIVVLEVGIGGKLDATNIIPPPLVSVILSVGMDHRGLLGNTISDIARQKSGIIKGNSVVSYPMQETEVLAVLMETCASVGSLLLMPSVSAVQIEQETIKGTAFRYGNDDFFVSLMGEHQVYNAVTAIEAARVLGFSEEAIKRGLRAVSFPARMEVLRLEPLILLDGAHNLPAMKMLCQNIRKWKWSPISVVVGMMKDKDVKACIKMLGGVADQIVTVACSDDRAVSASELAKMAKDCGVAVHIGGEPKDAAQWIQNQKNPTVICGSLYLASEIRPFLTEKL